MTLPEKQDLATYIRIKAAFGNANDSAIARRLKLKKQSVGKWKKGGSPSRSVFVRIAEITDVPLEWLMTGNDRFLEPKTATRLTVFLQAAESNDVEDGNVEIQLEDEKVDVSETMTLSKFVAELQSLGVEDFNPAKGRSGLTSADMEEVLALIRSKIKAKQNR